MTPREIYESLMKVGGSAVMTLSPGPFAVKVSQHDALAARLLLWLYDQLPPDAKVGDLEDVLDAAKWWSTFFASLVDEP